MHASKGAGTQALSAFAANRQQGENGEHSPQTSHPASSVWLKMFVLVAEPLKQIKSFQRVFLGPKEGEHIFNHTLRLTGETPPPEHTL